MAFVRIKKTGKRHYYYIVESRRSGAIVQQRILEYLGRDPEPKRLKRALRYWGVKMQRKGDQ